MCRRAGPAIAALALVACGGGGSGSSGPTSRLSFAASGGNAASDSGSRALTVSPPLETGESLMCGVDDAALTPCPVHGSSARVAYAGLRIGMHRLHAELRSPKGVVTAEADYQLRVFEPQVVVYGATPAGIAAAVAAARAGKSVALIESTRWLGGMMSGGLSKSDVGGSGGRTLGGLVREFFDSTGALETNRGACTAPNECIGKFSFEPQVAEQVFESWVAKQTRISLLRQTLLLGVERQGTSIRALQTTNGRVLGKVFIDATYEGDLMARAGVTYAIGRDARAKSPGSSGNYPQAEHEDHAGTGSFTAAFGPTWIDPYIVPGVPSSGLLPFVEPKPAVAEAVGEADHRVMAYNYRMCVTDDPHNQIPFNAPAGFDPAQYEGVVRVAQAFASRGKDGGDLFFHPVPTVRSPFDPRYGKFDLNGGPAFTTDMTSPGLNQAYVEADEPERQRIRAAYRSYIQGLLYFWRTDPRFGSLNARMQTYGLCKDEFKDNGHWPYALYVRTARRMQGAYVMNENDVMRNGRRPPIDDPVMLAAYGIDKHAYRIAVMTVGGARPRDVVGMEGGLGIRLPVGPYPVSYRALTPRAEEASNLLDPVTLSATDIALSSLRMEPTYMQLGQVAGIAAAISLDNNSSVQAVDYATLRGRLIAAGLQLQN